MGQLESAQVHRLLSEEGVDQARAPPHGRLTEGRGAITLPRPYSNSGVRLVWKNRVWVGAAVLNHAVIVSHDERGTAKYSLRPRQSRALGENAEEGG